MTWTRILRSLLLACVALASLGTSVALAAPAIATGQAEYFGIAGQTQALLHSDITPGCENADVRYTVEWGTSQAYGSTDSKSFNSPYGSRYDDYIQVMGLTPGSLYHYRGSATVTCRGGGGTVAGGDRCFVAGQVQADNSYNVTCPDATDPVQPAQPANPTGPTQPTQPTQPTDTVTPAKMFKVPGKRCKHPTRLAVWPEAVKTHGVPCRTITKLFQRNRGKLWSSKRFTLQPGPYKCVARSVEPSFALGFGLWKCSHGRSKWFWMSNEAFGHWADKPFGPRFDPRL
jgi:hypothetical protein